MNSAPRNGGGRGAFAVTVNCFAVEDQLAEMFFTSYGTRLAIVIDVPKLTVCSLTLENAYCDLAAIGLLTNVSVEIGAHNVGREHGELHVLREQRSRRGGFMSEQ